MAIKNMFNSSNNPMLDEKSFKGTLDGELVGGATHEPMTVKGAVNKTLTLMGIMLMTAVVGFIFPSKLFILGGAIAGFVVYMIASRNKEKSAFWAPVYAAIEGLFVGSVTAIYASLFSGIIFQAVTLTFAILFMMLMIYKSGLIKVTSKFRYGVSMAVGAVMLLYIVNIALYFFGISIPFLHDGGPMSIGICAVIIGIASLNLLLDFDSFDKGEEFGAPSYMEWYCAMGLLFTLVWLYVEILRMLSYLQGD